MKREIVLWAAVLAGPLIWFTAMQTNFVLAPWACAFGWKPALYVVSIVALAIVAGSGLLAHKHWKQLGEADAGVVAFRRDAFRDLTLCNKMFDLIALGKPVIITGWGGQTDYLGVDYPGLVRYEMTPVTGWLPHASYRPTQRWASADARHAGQLMRAAVTRDNVLLEAAVSVREAIAERYAESVIAPQFLAAIDG